MPYHKTSICESNVTPLVFCEDYIAHDTVENKDEVFTGLTKYLVDEQKIDTFYAGEKIYADKDEIKLPKPIRNACSNSNDKKTTLARFSATMTH